MITDEMVELGCAAISQKRGYDWPSSWDEEELRIGRENMRAALSAALSVETRVKVKPLEWVDRHHTLYASSIFGEYAIWEIGGSVYMRSPGNPGGVIVGRTIEEGKEAALSHVADKIASALSVEQPTPQQHVKGSLWDQLVVLSGYHITRPPTPDYEFVQVCNGDLRKMVELMGQSVPYEKTAGRWRAFEDTTPGYWGIELETAGDDDDAIMCPIKIHRDTVARIVEAHNDALATEGKA